MAFWSLWQSERFASFIFSFCLFPHSISGEKQEATGPDSVSPINRSSLPSFRRHFEPSTLQSSFKLSAAVAYQSKSALEMKTHTSIITQAYTEESSLPQYLLRAFPSYNFTKGEEYRISFFEALLS